MKKGYLGKDITEIKCAIILYEKLSEMNYDNDKMTQKLKSFGIERFWCFPLVLDRLNRLDEEKIFEMSPTDHYVDYVSLIIREKLRRNPSRMHYTAKEIKGVLSSYMAGHACRKLVDKGLLSTHSTSHNSGKVYKVTKDFLEFEG